MEFRSIIERVYENLERDNVEAAVMACLRIARNLRDHYHALLFLHELSPDKHQLRRTIFDDTADLKQDIQRELWERTLKEWLESRELEFSIDPNNPNNTVLTSGAGEMMTEIKRREQSIASRTRPEGMGEYDTAYFTDKFNNENNLESLRITALETVKQRVKTRCLNYAIRIEKQLEAQDKSIAFLHRVQTEVNNYFSSQSDDVYKKLLKATQLVDSANEEDAALLLTAVRRSIKAVADHFYPAVDAEIECSDGVKRKMGNEQYLNRLQEFLSSSLDSSTADDLVRSEFSHLADLARKLNEIGSKGVHASVTATEAKQGLVSLYMFLSNVVSRLQASPASAN